MHRTLSIIATLCLIVFLIATSAAQAVTMVGVTATTNLVYFDSATPGTIINTVPITGLLAGDTVAGIDFRPLTGELFLLGSASRLYTINPITGAATQRGTDGGFTLSGTYFGFAFAPVADRIRVVSNTAENLRLDPITGALAGTDTTLSYAPTDPNAGVNPAVPAAAYTNSFAGATTTTLYGIDTTLDILVRQGGMNVPPGTPSPNVGQLFTIGSLGIFATTHTGFDIQTLPNGTTAGWATLSTNGTSSGLYTINITTGAATLVGNIGSGLLLNGLALSDQRRGDLNGDGSSDIVLRNYSTGQNAVWTMTGTSLAAVVDLPALPNIDYRIEGTADFNLDGNPDIVLRNYMTGQNAIWLMTGTTVSSIVDLPALPNVNYHIEGTADFGGDSKPDIILRNYVTGQNALWIMNGTAVTSIVDLPALTNVNYRIESAADLNGDGKTDIVLRNYATGQNAVWLMNGPSVSGIVDLPALSNTNYRFDGLADLNGDTRPDIILRNYSTGQNAVWLLNGTTVGSVVDLPALSNTAYEINGPR